MEPVTFPLDNDQHHSNLQSHLGHISTIGLTDDGCIASKEIAKCIDDGHINPSMSYEAKEGVTQVGQNIDGFYTDGSSAIPQDKKLKVYAQRWYLVVLIGLQCGTGGGLMWNTWAPISDSAGRVFDWTNSDIALLTNWGPFCFILSAPFFAWLIDVKGLRIAALTSGAAIACGSALRIITSTNPAATWLINTGHIINGFALPMTMGVGPALSAAWFPVEQRTTATGAVSAINNFGFCVSFIIGPLLVPDRTNVTENPINTINMNASHQDISDTRQDIMRLMYIEFGIAAALFLLVLIYFPAKPPTPPSISAGEERTNFKKGMKEIFRHSGFWKIAFPYAISIGFYNPWMSVIHMIVKPIGISENTAGWAGFFSILAGSAFCLIIARFADLFKKWMKVYMIMLFTISLVTLGVFSLAVERVIPFSDELLYICLIVGGITLSGSIPLFYEMSCEATYPIAEGITISLLVWISSVTGVIFLFIMMIPNIGTSWMNWCMTGGVVLCLPTFALTKYEYNRLMVDFHDEPKSDQQISDKQTTTSTISTIQL